MVVREQRQSASDSWEFLLMHWIAVARSHVMCLFIPSYATSRYKAAADHTVLPTPSLRNASEMRSCNGPPRTPPWRRNSVADPLVRGRRRGGVYSGVYIGLVTQQEEYRTPSHC